MIQSQEQKTIKFLIKAWKIVLKKYNPQFFQKEFIETFIQMILFYKQNFTQKMINLKKQNQYIKNAIVFQHQDSQKGIEIQSKKCQWTFFNNADDDKEYKLKKYKLNKTSMEKYMKQLVKDSKKISELFQQYYRTTVNTYNLSQNEKVGYFIYKEIQFYFQSLSKITHQSERMYADLIKILETRRKQQAIQKQDCRLNDKNMIYVEIKVQQIRNFFQNKFQLSEKIEKIKISKSSIKFDEYMKQQKKNVNSASLDKQQQKESKNKNLLYWLQNQIQKNINNQAYFQKMTNITSSVNVLMKNIRDFDISLKYTLSDRQLSSLKKYCFGISNNPKLDNDWSNKQNDLFKLKHGKRLPLQIQKNHRNLYRSMITSKHEQKFVQIKQIKSQIIHTEWIQLKIEMNNPNSNQQKKWNKQLNENEFNIQGLNQRNIQKQKVAGIIQPPQKSFSQSEILINNYEQEQELYSLDISSMDASSGVETFCSQKRSVQIIRSEVISSQNDSGFMEVYTQNLNMMNQSQKEEQQQRINQYQNCSGGNRYNSRLIRGEQQQINGNDENSEAQIKIAEKNADQKLEISIPLKQKPVLYKFFQQTIMKFINYFWK